MNLTMPLVVLASLGLLLYLVCVFVYKSTKKEVEASKETVPVEEASDATVGDKKAT